MKNSPHQPPIILFPDSYLRVNALTLAELTLGIITASLPVLSVLATRTIKRLRYKPDGSQRYVFEQSRRPVRRLPKRYDESILESSLDCRSQHARAEEQADAGDRRDEESGRTSETAVVRGQSTEDSEQAVELQEWRVLEKPEEVVIKQSVLVRERYR